MTQETAVLRKTSNAYSIFILVLTLLSLAVMVAWCCRFLTQPISYFRSTTT